VWADKIGTGKVEGHRHRVEDNIKMDFTDYNLRAGFIYLVQNWIQCQTVVKMVMNLWIK
jgi:hypothetical protein